MRASILHGFSWERCHVTSFARSLHERPPAGGFDVIIIIKRYGGGGRLTQLLRRKGRGQGSLTRGGGGDRDLGQHFPPRDN